MLRPFSAALALLTALGAHAAQDLQPQPLAQPAQATRKPQLQRLPAPTLSVMRVTRQPDGTLVTDCVQRPNPRAHEIAKLHGAQP